MNALMYKARIMDDFIATQCLFVYEHDTRDTDCFKSKYIIAHLCAELCGWYSTGVYSR